MENSKKTLKRNDGAFIKKTSKVHLVINKSPKGREMKRKDLLEQTKQSLMSKSISRLDAGSHKRKKKQMIKKVASSSNFHPLKITNTNSRYLTQTFPNNPFNSKQSSNKKITKSFFMSPEKNTWNDKCKKSRKESLSSQKIHKEKSSENIKKENIDKAAVCQQISLNELQNVRKEIELNIKKMSFKESISKKDFLKITNQYQKLLNKIVLSQFIGVQKKNKSLKNSSVNTEPKEQQTPPCGFSKFKFNGVQNNKENANFKLKIENIKKQDIKDYHDEFMSHYDELSQSWKRDINIQKKY